MVLMDLGLPDRSGLSVGRDILDAVPDTKLIALTALDDASAVREALRSGFHAYVTKSTPVSHFLNSIRAVLDGQVVIPPRLAPAFAGARSEGERATQLLADQLTTRERQVLGLLVDGKSGPAIARQLFISSNTVRTHIQSILTKLQVHSRLEAAAFAVRNGVVDIRSTSVR